MLVWLVLILVHYLVPAAPFAGSIAKSRSFKAFSSRKITRNCCRLGAAESDQDPYTSFSLAEKVLFNRFAASVAVELGNEIVVPAKNYGELMAQINVMSSCPDIASINAKGKAMLVRLFPRWLLMQYKWMFAAPFPRFSAWMNAWVTKFATQWLMGESVVVDIDLPDGTVGKSMGLKIDKCRFLEEAGCVKTCLHACKVPTQDFFHEEMGLPVTLKPDMETKSCEFHFGVAPLPLTEDPIAASPCFTACSKASRSIKCM
jgi:hypothetical protein